MKKLSLTLLLALALTAGAQAGIMVNFTNDLMDDADTNTPGQVVGGIAGTTWNAYTDGTGGVMSLVDDMGANTSVSVELGKDDAAGMIDWAAGGYKPNNLGSKFGAGMNGDDSDIYDTNAQSALFVDDGGESDVAIAVRIRGLEAGTWEFYLVGRNTNNDGEGNGYDQYDVLAGTVATGSGDTDVSGWSTANTITNGPVVPDGGDESSYPDDANVSTWVNGQNYALVSLDVEVGEDVVLMLDPMTEGEARGFINTLQIVPEPATMSLLALGGLAVLRRRRR